MTAARRRGAIAVVTAVVLLALGAGVAFVVSDALGISSRPAEQMGTAAAETPHRTPVAQPAITDVEAPTTERIRIALDELAAARADALTADGTTSGEATLTITVTGESADAGVTRADDSYSVTGTASALRIEAATEAGAARGIYDLAADVRADLDIRDRLGRTVTSALPFRMVDIGAVGVVPDPDEWAAGDDYTHVSRAFADAYLPDAPYVNEAVLAADFAEWDAYLKHVIALGYNAVSWPGFIEYVDFATAPGVYAEGDPHIARAHALRTAFTPFWNRAQELGVDVFLRTDMLALTPELESYLASRFGTDTENPELWQVYTDALDEFYADTPAIAGVLIRVGEGGSIYAEPGWDYSSSLAVRSVDAVRTMLSAFTEQAEASGREVIFRTWSVGIGDVGDMHIDPVAYAQVLDGLDSPALIVSTKYTQGDFYSWLPLNATFEAGSSGASSSSSRAVSSRALARSRTISAPSSSGRLTPCSPPTRTSKVSGRGRKTAAPGVQAP